MTDLTKLAQRFGTLPRETQMALFEARLDGEDIEYYASGHWFSIKHPSFAPHDTYRVRPAPITYDTIDWSHVAPQLIAMARDEDGKVYLFDVTPKTAFSLWDSAGGANRRAETHASYTRGTCAWQDSLVLRPKGGV